VAVLTTRDRSRYRTASAVLAVVVLGLITACSSSSKSPAAGSISPTQTNAASSPVSVPSADQTAAASSPASASAASEAPAGTTPGDDGTNLTMWTRAATQAESQRLVDAYNASHKNHVNLTVIPTESYQQKVGSAAGAKQLPDLFASDIAFAPNFGSQGLWQDITSKIASLPFASSLSPAHIKAGTVSGKEYVMPHTMDLSVLFYNKDLYVKAGLDPNKPPTTLQEFADQAAAINKLGGGIHGTYFGGNCPGCLGFTWWPSIWADGGQVYNADGTASELASPQAKAVYAIYRKMYDDGVVAPGAKDEAGATWTGAFAKGNVGIMAMPSSTLGSMPPALLPNIGVAPIPGVTGGESTYVGGDVIGISADSKHADEAWNFLAWQVGDYAQVQVVAKNHDIMTRTDLASNPYTSGDPRLVLINGLSAKGVEPVSLNQGAAINDQNGPFLVLMRDAIFGDASKIDADNAKVSAALAGS